MGTDTPGVGYCLQHRGVELESGQAVAVVSEQAARPLAQAGSEVGYQLPRRTRLGAIAGDMGFRLEPPTTNAAGQVKIDLTGELIAARAMLAHFMETYADREDALALWAEAYAAGDLSMKPPRIMPVTEGHRAVLAIAQLARTMHDMQQSIPRAVFMRVMARIGDAVEAHVDDPAVKRKLRDDFLAASAEIVIGG